MDPLKFARSFGHGFRGLVGAVRSEQNMRVHMLALLLVVGAGFYFQIEPYAWIAVIVCVGMVIALECMNTALEALADRVSTQEDELIKRAKDVAAAGVLVAALTSLAVAAIVFGPPIMLKYGPN